MESETHLTPRVASRRSWAWLWWVAAAILAVVAYLLVQRFGMPFFARAAPPAKAAQRPIPVVAATARTGNLNIYLTSLGTVTAFNTVTIRSRIDGELVNVAFTEGQMVHEGDLLAEIDPRPFQVQLSQAEGQLAKDNATLTAARHDLTRDLQLAAAKAVAPQQLETQQALVNQLEGTVKSDQAQVDTAKLQLIYSRITSPIGGRIGLRRVDKGNLVQANDPAGLAVITQLQPIAVVFTVPQDDIYRIQQKLTPGKGLEVEAFNRDFQVKLAVGSLQALDNQVDPASGTVRLKAVFANDENRLFPNQFVNARLLVDTRRDAVLVSTAAVQRGPSSTFVYVINADKTVKRRDIVVGPAESDQTIIESGLAAGEIVATEGIDKLKDGSSVEISTPNRGRRRQGTTPGGTQTTSGTTDPQSAQPSATTPSQDAAPSSGMEGSTAPAGAAPPSATTKAPATGLGPGDPVDKGARPSKRTRSGKGT